MSYSVKEIFYTLQGEGANAGKAAVFCRFAGCNLWSGREVDRASAICQFCDTEFVGTDGTQGGKYESANALAQVALDLWPSTSAADPFIVLTGGEPLLQVDRALIDALHARRFRIAVETNGTIAPPSGLDWICVSPKAGAPLVITEGQELKVVVPQPGLDLGTLAALAFDHHFLQPMDGSHLAENTEHAVGLCLGDARWRLSIQTHKVIGIR
jgi:7-carboxy-7-deazaguanine synthase (Cx14CxxC type)